MPYSTLNCCKQIILFKKIEWHLSNEEGPQIYANFEGITVFLLGQYYFLSDEALSIY